MSPLKSVRYFLNKNKIIKSISIIHIVFILIFLPITFLIVKQELDLRPNLFEEIKKFAKSINFVKPPVVVAQVIWDWGAKDASLSCSFVNNNLELLASWRNQIIPLKNTILNIISGGQSRYFKNYTTSPYINSTYISVTIKSGVDGATASWGEGAYYILQVTNCRIDPSGDGCDARFDINNTSSTTCPIAPTPTPTSTPTPMPTPTMKPASPTNPLTPIPNFSENFFITKLYSVSGSIFIDNDLNGVKNIGELGYDFSNDSSVINISRRNDLSDEDIVPIPRTTFDRINGTYKFDRLASDFYSIIYPVPIGYRITNSLGNSSEFILGAECSISQPPIDLGPSCNAGNIINLNFGITNSLSWFQCYGLNCRFDYGVDNPVPEGKYALVNGTTSNDPGIIFSGTDDLEFGAGGASDKDWMVGNDKFTPSNSGVIRGSYAYVESAMKQSDIEPIIFVNNATDSNQIEFLDINDAGVYKIQGDLNIKTVNLKPFTFAINKNFVILVDGDLTINSKILVPNGSTASFLVKGKITISSSVGEAASDDLCTPSDIINGISIGCSLEGIYIADKDFIISSMGGESIGSNCINNQPELQDLQLKVAGSVIVNAALNPNSSIGRLKNYRDLCIDNKEFPAFTATGRPDLVLNAPALLRYQNAIWQEVAP